MPHINHPPLTFEGFKIIVSIDRATLCFSDKKKKLIKPTVEKRAFVTCLVLNDPTFVGMIFLGGCFFSPIFRDHSKAEVAASCAGGYGFKSPFVQVDLDVPLGRHLNVQIRRVGWFLS